MVSQSAWPKLSEPAAQQGGSGLAADGPGAGGDAEADEGHEQAGDDGEAARAVEAVEHGQRRVAGGAEVGPQALVLGPAGEQGGGGHASDAGQCHGAAAGADAVQEHAPAHDQGGAEQGHGGPGVVGGIAGAYLQRRAGWTGRCSR